MSAHDSPSLARSRNLSRSLPTFAACLLLSLSLFCASCLAGQKKTDSTDAPDMRELARQIDPSSWNLSPDAEHLYYYLLFADALAENFQPVINIALNTLIRLDPSLPVFQDGATILLHREEYAAAANIARQGLKSFPDDTLLTLLLAGTYSENDQTAKAISLLETHLKKCPSAYAALEELVRLYLRDKQHQKAVDAMNSFPEADSPPESELFRASVLASIGRIAEARSHVQQFLEKNPDSFEGWLEMGLLSLREKDFPAALAAYEKAATLDSENAELWLRIADIQMERKLPAETAKALENAGAPFSSYIQAALRFAEKELYAEAETMLTYAAAQGASPDEVALFLSIFKQDAGNSPLDGLPPLEKIPSSSPLYASALQQKGRIHMQAKQYDTAYSIAQEGRRLFPDQKEFWGLEAYALIRRNKKDEAEQLLKQAIERYGNDEELLFTLGSVQDEIGKKAEAMKTMERILEKHPQNYQALNYVGYTLAENNTELSRALKLITAALEQSPDADYIVDSLAWVQYRLGKMEEAWKNINRCISLGGDDATIWEHYGDIAIALNKREEAIKGYTESILREPDNIAAVRAKLRKLQK